MIADIDATPADFRDISVLAKAALFIGIGSEGVREVLS